MDEMSILNIAGTNYEIVDEKAREELVKVQKTVKIYHSVAEMLADKNLNDGDNLTTLSYYENENVGGGNYLIVTNETANGLDVLALNNGLFAVLQYNDEIKATQCGLKANSNADAFFKRFNNVANKINIDIYDLLITETIILNTKTEIYSSIPINGYKFNIKWASQTTNNAAMFSTLPDGNGLINNNIYNIFGVNIHDLSIYGAGRVLCGFVFMGIASHGNIKNLYSAYCQYNFVIGSVWSLNIGALYSTHSKKCGVFQPTRFDKTPIDMTNDEVGGVINATTFNFIEAKGEDYDAVSFRGYGGDNNVNTIAIEAFLNIGLYIEEWAGTFNSIHIENDTDEHPYDIYVENAPFADISYNQGYSLIINEIRARKYYFNGSVTIDKVYMYPQTKENTEAEYFRIKPVFESGNYSNLVTLLNLPVLPKSDKFYNSYTLPYGINGIETEHNDLSELKILNTNFKELLGSNYEEQTIISNSSTVQVPENALPYAKIRYYKGHSGKTVQKLSNGNFETLDGWLHDGASQEDIVNNNQLSIKIITNNPINYDYTINIKTTNIDMVQGHSYYIGFDILKPYIHDLKFMVATTAGNRYVNDLNVDANDWVRSSVIFNSIPGDVTLLQIFLNTLSSYGYVKNDEIKIRNFMVIDLTEKYGSNIPTKDELDNTFVKYLPTNIISKVTKINSSSGDSIIIPKVLQSPFMGKDTYWNPGATIDNPNTPYILYRGYGESNPTDDNEKNVIDFDLKQFRSYGYIYNNQWLSFEELRIDDISYCLPNGYIAVEENGQITFETEYESPLENQITFYIQKPMQNILIDEQELQKMLDEVFSNG